MARQNKSKRVLKVTPNELHRQGLRLYGEGRMEEAQALLQAVLNVEENSERWNDWGAVQHALGFSKEAEAGLRKALELDQKNLQAAANLGSLLVGQGRPVEAAPLLLAALNTTDEPLRAAVEGVISQITKLSQATDSPAVMPKR
jgi:Flp pilus assembly protein TadD